ncbi:hypothetical protein CSUI_009551 [Cystoisospora suis]|uniref:Uncharacterized protein n=1 Tax=Cystoisospora suis TaxID=483139 RepID=A0A2C6KJP9_9APIC|nr:hypothetical protein CSUI_009551 [Cystoisospora suis]
MTEESRRKCFPVGPWNVPPVGKEVLSALCICSGVPSWTMSVRQQNFSAAIENTTSRTLPSRRRGNNKSAEAAERRRWLDSQPFQMAPDVYTDDSRQESRESRAYPSVHRVKQTGPIRDYVDSLNEALYHEPEMSDKDEVKAF